jgi:hypothetical protein
MLSPSFATNNTLNKLLNSSYKIMYDPHHSLFDRLLSDTGVQLYYTSNSNIFDYNYDALMTSNFIQHSSQRQNIRHYHLSDSIFIHECLNKKFKKEDRIILKQNLSNSYKVILHDSILPSWQFLENKIYNISYGIHTNPINYANKINSVLIFNLRKNSEMNTLYQYIKNVYKDTVMITDVEDDWDSIYKQLASYKIVIDEGSIINQLIASYCKCVIITPHIHFDKKIFGFFNLNNFNNILELINSINKTYEVSNLDSQIDHIKHSYPFEKFKYNILSFTNMLKQEIFSI